MADTNASVGVGSGKVLNKNEKRRYTLFINDSANTIYLRFGSAAELNKGIRLNASGGAYEMSRALDNIDKSDVYAIATGAASNLLIVEV